MYNLEVSLYAFLARLSFHPFKYGFRFFIIGDFDIFFSALAEVGEHIGTIELLADVDYK